MMLRVAFSGLSLCALGKITSYEYTDPARFGLSWEAESLMELNRRPSECFCGESPHSAMWNSFQSQLLDNLAADPSFSGVWVHVLCSVAHPWFFKLAAIDPSGMLVINGDCSAGLMAMAVVCAQSIALQDHASSSWQWRQGVVMDEGNSAGDFEGRIALAECVELCEGTSGCRSFAHGPNGCHLKDRCVHDTDELQPPESHGDGYRTFFLSPCQTGAPDMQAFSDVADVASSAAAYGGQGSSKAETAARPEASSREDELLLFADTAMRVVESAAHCLPESPWPFSVSELVANHVSLLDDPDVFLWSRGLSSPGIPTTSTSVSAGTAQTSRAVSGHGHVLTTAVSGKDGAVHRTLERALIRWARSLGSEVGFWRELLEPPETSNMAPTSAGDARLAHRWLETGEVQWSWDDLCGFVVDARSTGQRGSPRILNTGSGPLAPGPLSCGQGVGKGSGASTIPVVSTDGLARFYLRSFDELGVQPPQFSIQCPVESLQVCFPREHFDVVHMRNALDHAVDPLLGIRRMLEVTRPGGWVLLRHARNEGVPGQFRVGLHQWAFDVVQDGSSARFVIWNPQLRADVTTWLLESRLAQEVRTELRPHPEGGESDFVWVDIRKPL